MILSICDLPEVLKVVKLIKLIITIIKIVVPIILIVSAMIDLVRAVSNSELNKISKTIVNKVIAAVIVFLIPTFVSLLLKITMTEDNYSKCFNNATNENIKQIYTNKMEELINIAKEKETIESIGNAKNYLTNIDDIELRKKYENEIADIEKKIEEKREEERKQNDNSNGTTNGRKFNLSDEDIIYLTRVCVCEQGSAEGAAGEASLIANRYDLYGSKYSSIVSYVKNSGWWACANKNVGVKQDQIDAVRKVINDGVRSFPLYVDEHDCFNCAKSNCSNGNKGDICYLETNGVKITNMNQITDRSIYVRDKTIIYNKYGATYTFYSFPCERCDPFGYTQKAYNLVNEK